jgi:hypothetical protein
MLLFGPQYSGCDTSEFDEAIRRLEILVEDMRIVASSGSPDIPESLDVPVLEDWRPAFRATICLVGLSTGHPRLPGRRREIVTSPVAMLSEELGWARTNSRWYRLGKPSGMNSSELS